MRRFRFHLSTMLLIVLLTGVGFAALRESDEIWDSEVFTLVLAVLLVSILLAVHRTEKSRAFWLGFAFFGAAYLGLSLVPPIESRLSTTEALAFIDSNLPRSMTRADALYDLLVGNNSQPDVFYVNKGNGTFQDVTATVGSNSGNQATGSGTFYLSTGRLLVRGSVGTTENFMRIGHSLLSLTVALAGGQLSRRLHSRSLGSTSEPSDPATGHQPTEPRS